jgi:hypothetical protein
MKARMPHPHLLAILPLFLLAASACDVRLGRLEPPPPIELPEGQQAVQLEVIEGPGGSVLVFIPVMISGQGPFRFALDTGASQTLVDSSLVEELGLAVTGEIGPVTGVVGATIADEVQIEEWSIGEIALPAITAVGLELAAGAGHAQFRGLLGADILRRFQVITLDFDRQLLIVGEDGG